MTFLHFSSKYEYFGRREEMNIQADTMQQAEKQSECKKKEPNNRKRNLSHTRNYQIHEQNVLLFSVLVSLKL